MIACTAAIAPSKSPSANIIFASPTAKGLGKGEYLGRTIKPDGRRTVVVELPGADGLPSTRTSGERRFEGVRASALQHLQGRLGCRICLTGLSLQLSRVSILRRYKYIRIEYASTIDS
jgi:hypothetical protein